MCAYWINNYCCCINCAHACTYVCMHIYRIHNLLGKHLVCYILLDVVGTYIHRHTQTHMHACTHAHIYTHARMHAHIQTHMLTRMHTQTDTHTHAHRHTCTHRQTHACADTHKLTHTCTHTDTHTRVSMLAHTHRHTHTHMHRQPIQSTCIRAAILQRLRSPQLINCRVHVIDVHHAARKGPQAQNGLHNIMVIHDLGKISI